MSNKSTTNVNSIQDTNNGYTVVKPNDGDYKNSSNLALKTGYQRPSSREDIDNNFITEQKLCERIFSWRSFIVALLHLSLVLCMMPSIMMPMALVCMCGPVSGPTNDTLNHSRLPPISMLTPLKNITAPQGSFEEWRVVWISMALVNFTAGMVFLIFGNASLQSWAVTEPITTIVKVQDQSSSDLKLSNDHAAASLSTNNL